MTMYPDGINLRKEAQKIDIKQFDPNNVNHVSTMMAVMRPIPGLKDQPTTAEEAAR